MKKPFKETKVGKLVEKVAGVAVDVLPDKGILGIAKNIIESATVSEEEKEEMRKELHEYEIEVYKLEVSDRDSARNREIEIAKAGGHDHLMYAAGYTALIDFTLMVVAVIFFPEQLKENPMAHQLMGIVEGVALLVFGYYFGATLRAKK